MKQIRIVLSLTLVSAAALLGGCATDGPATDGASVRSIVARQIADPQPQRRPATIDGNSAVEIVKNYNDSYANPQPQQAGSAFGR
ncbi:hypothetical protein [Massilia sp.]|uniref:hypothetical protein n=1 Tax=Massilia sp. TaxID=1882437 RepID=UPI00289CCA08|nr:hypothetical protein [Massilia sp.]